jgi:signal transduction histidine kinase
MHDLYLFYGATFFAVGVLLAFQARLVPEFLPRGTLRWLAGFGLTHGIGEWAQISALDSGGDGPGLRIVALGLAVTSYAMLSQFAVTTLAAFRQWPRWSLLVPAVLSLSFVVIVTTLLATVGPHAAGLLHSLEAIGRYAFGLPASLLTAWTLWVLRKRRERDRVGRYLAWASASFVMYAIVSGTIVDAAPMFPASHLNSELFLAVTHIPIEIPRMACALAMALALSEAFVTQAARDRQELERRREEFIAIVAHDLRSPIGVIDLGAEMLAQHLSGLEGVDQQSANRFLRNIRTGAHGLERMVQDLLDVTRIETNQLALETRDVDVRALVTGILDRGGEATRGHSVTACLPEDLPLIHADPMRVEQIVVNVLSNAGKYSTPGSEIVITARAGPDEVEIAVTNQGGGLSQDEIEQVFTRFYRSENARHADGLGLGLYIVKGLVEAQGGRIWVESEVGRYATFRFTLPRVDTRHGSVRAASAPPAERAPLLRS